MGDRLVTAAPKVVMTEIGKSRIHRFKLQARMYPNRDYDGNSLRDWKTIQSSNFGNDEKNNSARSR